jgi:hypothetical protein
MPHLTDNTDGLLNYQRLLERARLLSAQALDRLCAFPEAELPDLIGQLERLRADPEHERRRAVRLRGGPQQVTLSPAEVGPGELANRSPGGLALRLSRPVPVGSVLLVGPAGTQVEVRHCRRRAGGWLVGCEVLDPRREGDWGFGG